MELVSIVMLVYNNEKFLRDAFESVISLDYPNIEIIAIDDGSSDHSFAICQEYAAKDNRIKVFRHNINRGTPQTLKTGIKHSSGKYIFCASGDDVSFPDRINKCMDIFLHSPNIGIIVSNAIVINEDNQETGEVYEVDAFIDNNNIGINQFKRNYCLGATMAFVNDKDILLREDMFEYLDDYEVSLEYLLNGYDIAVSNRYLIKYRIHANNFSNNNSILRNRTVMLLKKYQIQDIEKNFRSRNFSEKNIYTTLGIIELFKENNILGDEFLKRVNSLDDNNERVLFENNFYLGVASYRLQDYKESYNSFKNAFMINNNEPTILNNFGVISCLVNNELEYASNLISKSIEINNGYIDALSNMAVIRDGKDDFKITPRILATANIKRVNYII